MDEEPDYRYSLANERTYLAWVRTGLALIAAGIAIRLFITETAAATQWLAIAALGFAALGGVLTVTSYRHWLRVQEAMRSGEQLPTQRGPLILTIGMVLLALVVVIGILL